jgi:hypothetical protein
MFPPVRVGPQVLSDGSLVQERATRDGCNVAINGHCSYQEANYRGNLFSMVLPATTGTVTAGNIAGAAAAAVTQFALSNPVASGKHLVLLRFRLGYISATMTGAGPIFHGTLNGVPTLAPNGTILSNQMGAGPNSVARGYALAAGTALTGGPAPAIFMLANFANTATSPASPYLVSTDDLIDGCIIIPPGQGWLPLWQNGGTYTAALCGMSITWEEIAI